MDYLIDDFAVEAHLRGESLNEIITLNPCYQLLRGIGHRHVSYFELGFYIFALGLAWVAAIGSKRAIHEEKMFQNLPVRCLQYVTSAFTSWRLAPQLYTIATFCNLFADFCPFLSDALTFAFFFAGRAYGFVGLAYFLFFMKSLLTPMSSWETWISASAMRRIVATYTLLMSMFFIFVGNNFYAKLTTYFIYVLATLGILRYFQVKFKNNPYNTPLSEDENSPMRTEIKLLKMAMFVYAWNAAYYMASIFASRFMEIDILTSLPVGIWLTHAALENYGEKIESGHRTTLCLISVFYDGPSVTIRHINSLRNNYRRLSEDRVPFAASYNSINEQVIVTRNV